MGNITRELSFKNESETTDPLLGDVQFDPAANTEQRQSNDSVHTIEQDSLVFSAGRASSVSGCKITMIKFCWSPERSSISLVLRYLLALYLMMKNSWISSFLNLLGCRSCNYIEKWLISISYFHQIHRTNKISRPCNIKFNKYAIHIQISNIKFK